MNVSKFATHRIGRSDLKVVPIGVGTWQWGDRRYWGYGDSYGEEDLAGAYRAAIGAKLNFFDTAEIYGNGESERLLGRCIETMDKKLVVASKYMPFPNRFTGRALEDAVDASLERLGLDRIDLYQIHWPFTLMPHRKLLKALADVVQAGKVRWVGVSNYGASRLKRAQSVLAEFGVELVSNQVNYSLLNRAPEINGVLDTCRQLDITLIAYSPLGKGLLTGKYDHTVKVPGLRGISPGFSRSRRRALEPLLEAMRDIARAHSRQPSQVALNWLVRKPGVMAIPGVKSAAQVTQNAGALGWSITDEDTERLNLVSAPWVRRSLMDRII